MIRRLLLSSGVLFVLATFMPFEAAAQDATPAAGVATTSSGKTAELLASEFGISRKEQDEFALRSHQKAAAAMAAGRFKDEIVPVYVPGRDGFEAVTEDVGPRATQTLEALAKLKPILDRKDGTVTVGNSCQITDGAAALLLTDPDYASAEELSHGVGF